MKNGKVKMNAPNKFISFEEAFGGGELTLPPAVAKEFADKKWTPRWLNVKKMANAGGVHDRGWQLYRSPGTNSSDHWIHGNPPDGTIRRGDLVLGYKTEEKIALHRQYVEQRGRVQRENIINAQRQGISVDDE